MLSQHYAVNTHPFIAETIEWLYKLIFLFTLPLQFIAYFIAFSFPPHLSLIRITLISLTSKLLLLLVIRFTLKIHEMLETKRENPVTLSFSWKFSINENIFMSSYGGSLGIKIYMLMKSEKSFVKVKFARDCK